MKALRCDIINTKRVWLRTNTWQHTDNRTRTLELFIFVVITKRLWRFKFRILGYGYEICFDPFLKHILFQIGKVYFDYFPIDIRLERSQQTR